jgi:signal transduction histidine kinase
VTVAFVVVTLFVVGVPALYEEYRTFSRFVGDRNEAYANLAQLGLSVDFYAGYQVALGVAFAAACLALATLIFVRKSDEPIALFVSLVLVLLGASFSTPLSDLAIGPEALHPVLSWLSNFRDNLYDICLLLFFYLFPDGRFVPRWTRWLAALLIVWLVLMSSFPGSLLNPENWPEGPSSAVALGFLFIGGIAQVYRYRRVAGPLERQQMKWVVSGFMLALVGFLTLTSFNDVFPSLWSGSLADLVNSTAVYCFMLLIPLSLTIAILRYRLWDIDIIINRTLVYGALSASVVGLYALLVSGLGSLLPASDNFVTSLVATGLIAILFTPLRVRLQRNVNRLMYGERDDPYAVLSRLGQRLETALAPEAALETVAEAVSQALKIPYTAIELRHDGEFRIVSEHGTPKGESVTLPLMHQREEVGRMLVSPRAPGENFSPEDRRLLQDLARQAGAAVHAARLTADLRRSRERLVTAREEERRRLRRDLHDGLGPTLGGLTLGLDAARSTLPQGASTTETLLTELKAQSQEAVSDIRRLVHGLRPPALDDLGLVSAIRQEAIKHGNLVIDFSASMEGSDLKNGLTFSVKAPENLPPLPAAVEVACYRIAQEAITNVSRHAKASRCWISLVVDEAWDALVLEVADDGVGVPEGRRAGVGTNSMRERAEELSGTLTIEQIREGGTRVLARLPLPAKDPKEKE